MVLILIRDDFEKINAGWPLPNRGVVVWDKIFRYETVDLFEMKLSRGIRWY